MSTTADFHRLHPREYAGFTYAYPVISRRSGGVSIGVNLNLDQACNFDCPYCQVDRTGIRKPQRLDPVRIREEVEALLDAVDAQGICRLPLFAALPDAEKQLRDVALSGDGEPTLVPEFPTICKALGELQSQRPELPFKLVLITNATLLDRVAVQSGIDFLLAQRGEVWAKLDAGSESWYQRVNVSRVPLDRVEANLVALGKKHSFKVQSFFCHLSGDGDGEGEGRGWDENEQASYLERLQRVRASGAKILEVQLYTLARKPSDAKVTPVERGFLEHMRGKIEALGISAQVYGGEN